MRPLFCLSSLPLPRLTQCSPCSAFDLLHYKDVDIDRLVAHVPGLDALSPRTLERIGIAGKCVALSPPSSLPLPLVQADTPSSCARRYKQHILRQTHDIALFLRDENLVIDSTVDYDAMPGMSHEVRQRLKDARPTTLVRAHTLSLSPDRELALSRRARLTLSNVLCSQGQAKRLEGVTPASLACLMKYVRNGAARRAELDAATLASSSTTTDGPSARLGL